MLLQGSSAAERPYKRRRLNTEHNNGGVGTKDETTPLQITQTAYSDMEEVHTTPTNSAITHCLECYRPLDPTCTRICNTSFPAYISATPPLCHSPSPIGTPSSSSANDDDHSMNFTLLQQRLSAIDDGSRLTPIPSPSHSTDSRHMAIFGISTPPPLLQVVPRRTMRMGPNGSMSIPPPPPSQLPQSFKKRQREEEEEEEEADLCSANSETTLESPSLGNCATPIRHTATALAPAHAPAPADTNAAASSHSFIPLINGGPNHIGGRNDSCSDGTSNYSISTNPTSYWEPGCFNKFCSDCVIETHGGHVSCLECADAFFD